MTRQSIRHSIQKNILIFGVKDHFGENIVSALAIDGNSLLLCGESEDDQRRLMDAYPGYVKGVSSVRSIEHQKQVQTLIESQGSLHAVIYLLGPTPASCLHRQSGEHIREILQSSLLEPILWFQAVYPYLRKSSDCKVLFVDTDVFTSQPNQSVVQLASQYGLWGFCLAMQRELKNKGIDATSISAPAFIHTRQSVTQPSNHQYRMNCLKVAAMISDVIRSVGEETLSNSASAAM